MKVKMKKSIKKLKKSRKSALRIIEAIIGLLIILLGLVYFVSQQTKQLSRKEHVKEIATIILDEIEKNATLRSYVQYNNINELNSSIAAMLTKLAPRYEFNFCLTASENTCLPILPEKKDIYVSSLLISYVDGGNVNATKLILFLWPK
ncbi:MAG: hypothetical protein QW199_02425 [Candidatus Pacearchaeota archaeon]